MVGTEDRLANESGVNRHSLWEGGQSTAERGRSLTDGMESNGARSMQSSPVSEPLNLARFVCGEENPYGPHLRFQADGRSAFARWTPTAEWESSHGIIHGGIISAVLDEVMSKAIISGGD